MKKIVIPILCLILIIITSIIGYIVVSANTEVEKEENIIINQNENQQYFKSYGYTIENPNIILNPYDISPLTALIIFETETAEKVKITIEGKTKETTYTNEFKASKTHYIPIYGLYPDYVNKVKIKCNNIEKTYEIKTNKIPEELSQTITNSSNTLLFVTTSTIPYAIDQNNDIRWYLTKKYSQKITKLSNNHILLSNDKKDEHNYHTGMYEIDLLGKIYKEYKIKTGYYGSYAELENTLLVLSKDLLEIDKQTGIIINKIKLTDTYETLNIENNIITLTNNKKELKINKNTTQEILSVNSQKIEENKTSLNFYNNNEHYKLEKGISFNLEQETNTSPENIFLINYKKTDKNYNKYNIKLKKETDRLVLSGEFNKNDKVYIILDKFMDKKVYDVKIEATKTYKYINNENLKGKYSIYIKINNKLYKTNRYVTF